MPITSQIIKDIFQQEKNLSRFFLKLGEIVLEEFASVKLIGEIERPEGKDTYEVLRSCLQSLFVHLRQFPLLLFETERGHSRAVLSLYFVWSGIFLYGEEQGHELWPHIFQGLGHEYDANLSRCCGQLFMECLKENNLETFDFVTSGHIYLTRILLHGLIPERHIERFIREFILESLSEPGGFHKTGHALIEDWITQKYLVPKPIERFLRYGWPVNVQLVERFLDMAKRWNEDDQNHWWQWGLPKYMVDAFRRCVKTHHNNILKKRKGFRIAERAFLIFDYASQNQPIILLPPQRLESEGEIKISYRDFKRPGEEITETKTLRGCVQEVNGNFYSEQQKLLVGPSDYWQISIVNNMQRVRYNYPEGESRNKVPLYLFSGNSGKAIKFGSDSRIPEEIIVIYPEDAILELSGGTFLSEPVALLGKWRGWICAYCTLDKKGTFHYYGPDCFFTRNIEERLSFKRVDEQADQPSLYSVHKAPHWLRCNDQTPIVFNPKGLHIHFSNQAYRFWKRGVGKLRRLDLPLERPKSIPFKLSDGKKTENGTVIPIPRSDDIEPGVYEVYLRGAIGIDDFKIPFVYLPILHCERSLPEEKISVAKEFLIEFSEMVPMVALEGTKIIIDSQNCKSRVFLEEDRADAYCALKIFHETARPIVLLLERSEIRWIRHSESGLYDWPYWRARPEIIPIQRLNEIRDSRALIEIGQALVRSSKGCGPKISPLGKLRIILQGRKNENAPMVTLMAHEAPKFKRRFRTIWLIDLKQFSDQLTDLQGYQRADISIDCGDPGEDIPLFTLLRRPEYENFQVLSLTVDQNSEKLQITWNEKPNEPQENRILKVYPLEQPNKVTSVSVPNYTSPPITVSLEPTNEAELWAAELDIREGRFHTSRSQENFSPAQTHWLRIPHNWYDWLEWAFYSVDHCLAYFNNDESRQKNVNLQSMPFSYFLCLFGAPATKSSYKALINLIGKKVLEIALPFTEGSKWEIKSGSKTFLSAAVISSSVDTTEEGLRCFDNCSPTQWHYFPNHIEMKLQIKQSSRFLGKTGTIWTLLQTPEEKEPLLISETEGILEIGYWIKDAVIGRKRTFLYARIPFKKLWDMPPKLPLLKELNLRDTIFIKDAENSEFGKIFSIMKTDKTSNDYAFDLVNRWTKWSCYPDINPLFRRMIKGRLQFSSIGIITGALAFISRLTAVDQEASVFKIKTDHSPAIKSMEPLVSDTYEFVKEFLPVAFLRDLILSELVIAWYWQKHLWAIEA